MRPRGRVLPSLPVAVLLGAAVLVGQCPAAPAGDYLVDVWDTERGLPNSSVTAIAQTPDGYLWVGTYNGLARFDGVRFVVFDPGNTPALRHARIRKLFLDPTGGLWVNTYDGSLTSMRRGTFRLEWPGSGLADSEVSLVSTRSNRITFLLYRGELIRRAFRGATNEWQTLRPPGAGSGAVCCEDGEGNLWYRGRDQKPWRIAGDTFEAAEAPAAPPGRRISSLLTDAKGRVWAGTDSGLFAWDGAAFENLTPTNGETRVDVTFLHPTHDGAVWSLANGRVRKSAGRRWVAEAETLRGLFAGGVARLGAADEPDGGAWLYHYGRGLFRLADNGAARRLGAEDGFPGERVDCLFRDREGNVWAGVDRGGLVRLRAQRFQVVAASDGGAPRAATTVCEDAAGAILMGTFGAGLHRWFDGRLTGVPLALTNGGGFVFSAFPEDSRLWLSAGDEDLCLLENGSLTAPPVPVHAVKALLADRRGRLWLGLKSALACLEGGRLRTYGPPDGIEAVDIRALAEGPGGTLWAGSGRGALYELGGSGVVAHQPTDALAQQAIWALLADADGTVWAGTFRGGLLRFKDGGFTRYTSAAGLPSDVVCQLLDDGLRHLWLGTHAGLARLSRAELEAFARGDLKRLSPTVYGRFDGLPALECSGGYQPAAWRAKDGRLWFATVRGLVSVQPEEIRVNRRPPTVVIEEALADGKGLPLEAPPAPARARRASPPPAAALRVRVPPGQRQVEFRYTGLSLSAPDKVRFQLMLEPLEADWFEAGDRRWVQYSYLRPGDYVFHVRACNSDGVWNDVGAALAVEVLPRFYERWWFLALAAAGVVGSVAASVRHAATRRLRLELQRLEQQRAVERDRARIAKDIHDDLGAGLTQIALLSELARRDPPEEVPAHLAQISGTARELTRAMDEIVWAINPHNDTLDSLITYVAKFAQDYLGVARIRCRLDLPAEVPPLPLTTEVRHNLFLAVKEAINNVVKHAHASEAWLRVALGPGHFLVAIEDNGRGLAPGHAGEAINGHGRISAGHGLANFKQRLAAIGGECRVASQPGQGTRVEFTVRFAENRSPILATAAGAPPHA